MYAVFEVPSGVRVFFITANDRIFILPAFFII